MIGWRKSEKFDNAGCRRLMKQTEKAKDRHFPYRQALEIDHFRLHHSINPRKEREE